MRAGSGRFGALRANWRIGWLRKSSLHIITVCFLCLCSMASHLLYTSLTHRLFVGASECPCPDSDLAAATELSGPQCIASCFGKIKNHHHRINVFWFWIHWTQQHNNPTTNTQGWYTRIIAAKIIGLQQLAMASEGNVNKTPLKLVCK